MARGQRAGGAGGDPGLRSRAGWCCTTTHPACWSLRRPIWTWRRGCWRRGSASRSSTTTPPSCTWWWSRLPPSSRSRSTSTRWRRSSAPAAPSPARIRRYEDRPEQRALTRMIGERYNQGGIGIAEAGTGTGKSLAYLLPAIRWALQNRERTVVSTNTINLQEQLVDKDLPFLRQALGEPFRFALVKGRNNYVSIRRARLALEARGLADRGREAGRSSRRSSSGSRPRRTARSAISLPPLRRGVGRGAVGLGRLPARASCPHFEECFYQRARREAASADVLVVNHHLLFSDLAVRRAQGNYSAPAVLPHYRRLVLDEAHNLEEAATQHLGATASRRAALPRAAAAGEPRQGRAPVAAAGAAGRPAVTCSRRPRCDLIEERLIPALQGAPRARRERLRPPGAGAPRVGWADDAHGARLRRAPGVGRGARRGAERAAGAPGRRCSGGWSRCGSASPSTRRRRRSLRAPS